VEFEACPLQAHAGRRQPGHDLRSDPQRGFDVFLGTLVFCAPIHCSRTSRKGKYAFCVREAVSAGNLMCVSVMVSLGPAQEVMSLGRAQSCCFVSL